MGTKKQTTTSTIPGASSGETAIRDLLSRVSWEAAGQLGDLSGYASGEAYKLTPEDLALIAQAVGSRTEAATGALQEQYRRQNANLEDTLASTGQKDSSIELVKRLLQSGEQARGFKDIQLQGQAMGAEYGMKLPYQRAEAVNNANSQILSRLGLANPVLQSFLQERMAQGTQTGTQSGFTMSDTMSMFSSLLQKKG